MALVYYSIYLFVQNQRSRNKTINKIQKSSSTTISNESQLSNSIQVNAPSQTFVEKTIGYIGSKFVKNKDIDYSKNRLRFLQAGLRGDNISHVYNGFKLTLPIVFSLVVVILKLFLAETLTAQLTISFLCFAAILGFYAPDIWISSKISKRKLKILNGFPDALDLMVVCVEAGLGLGAAIDRVSKEIRIGNKDLSDELRLVTMEFNAGLERRTALKNLQLRTGVDDISDFVVLILQAEKFGTSIAQSLRTYSESLRTKRFMRAEENAAKMSTKMLLPLVFFLFPVLFIVLVGPSMINVYNVMINK